MVDSICTLELDKNNVDEDDPWKVILAVADFSIRSTFHTTNENHLDN